MKKFLLGLSLLAIAGLWTGCSKDDEVVVDSQNDAQAISFRVQGGMPNLRATGTSAAYVNAFVVYGNDDQAVSNIFAGTTVARQPGSGDVFDYNPKKYYSPNATAAKFAAYSPVSKKISAPAFVFGTGLVFNYEVVTPDNTGNTTQEDLLVAGTSVDVSSLTPPTYVQFDFKHALSRIFVKAANNLNETVIIKNLKLKNLNSTGKITGAPGATWTWSWGTLGVKKDYGYVLAPTGVAVKAGLSLATLVTSMEQGMLILPQETENAADDASAGDFALEVEYNIANVTDVAYVYLPDGYEFEMGKQYAITIDFSSLDNLIEIDFTITVSDFETPIIDLP